METLFGAEMPLALRFFIAFLFVLALIGGAAYLVRRFGSGALSSAASRGRQPRLAVIDAAPVDGRRRLVLIRRDNVEHLIMIGGPTDIVVEPNIVRAVPPAAVREAPAARVGGDAVPRAVPLTEGAMWPLQPEPVVRTGRPAPEEAMWPAPTPAEPAARTAGADRLAGLAADLSRAASAAAPEHVPSSPRPVAAELRRPASVAAAPAAPPHPAASSDDQNLAEMAHRLEAALRRPPHGEGAPADTGMTKPVTEPMLRPAAPPTEPVALPLGPRAVPPAEAAAPPLGPRAVPQVEPAAPPFGPRAVPPGPVPDIARMTVDPKPPQKAPRPEPKQGSQATKSVYDSLEQEMASLLGRPSGKS